AERRGAGDPALISGDPEMGPTARRTTGAALPHQRLSALCSPHLFEEEQKKDKGHPPPPNGTAERWLHYHQNDDFDRERMPA
ncbi:MAG: hypothetical protein WCE79_28495, partial [Xanthobacteraceae bacterium]